MPLVVVDTYFIFVSLCCYCSCGFWCACGLCLNIKLELIALISGDRKRPTKIYHRHQVNKLELKWGWLVASCKRMKFILCWFSIHLQVKWGVLRVVIEIRDLYLGHFFFLFFFFLYDCSHHNEANDKYNNNKKRIKHL